MLLFTCKVCILFFFVSGVGFNGKSSLASSLWYKQNIYLTLILLSLRYNLYSQKWKQFSVKNTANKYGHW